MHRYFLVQNSPSVSFVVSYNLKTFVVRVCSYVLWNPQRLSAHSFKKCSRTKFEMFLFESSGNSLEENIHFMSQEITVATGKIHSTWLNPGNFLKMIFLFLSLEKMEWMRVELSRTVTHFLHLQMYNLLDCFEHRKYVLQWPKESNFAFSAKKNHFILPREYPKEKMS